MREPEGDVQPRAYLHLPIPGEAEATRLFRADLPFDWFSSREAKDELTARLALVIRALRARKFAWSTTQYLVVHNLDEWTEEERRRALEGHEIPDRVPMPSKDPRRIEVLGVHAFDAERTESWFAEIKRTRRRPPRYLPWGGFPGHDDKPFERDPGLDATGLMSDPIKEALR